MMQGVAKLSLQGRSISLFVTGTDTSVGKTLVCSLLLGSLRDQGINAGYQKWVSTGSSGVPEDLMACQPDARYLSAVDDRLALQIPYRFAYPASPHLAARLEGREVDPGQIVASHAALSAAHEVLIVEGVGGILVPLRRDLLLADLVASLGLMTLVVARAGLGTLNHTLLTLEALRFRQVPVLGVVLSDMAIDSDKTIIEDNLRTIAEVGKVEVFGCLPFCPDQEAAKQAFIPIGKAVLSVLLP